MKMNEEQLKVTLAKMPEGTKPEYLQQIVAPFPDQTPFFLLQGAMISIIKRDGNQVEASKVSAEITSQLKAKAPATPGQNKPGDTKQITRDYFDELLIEQRLIDSVIPDTKTEIFGETFSTPIMTAALSHLGPSTRGLPNSMCEYAAGAAKADTLHWIGMCDDEDFEQYMSMGARTVRIIKPYADEDKIFAQIECCKKMGAVACGIDIDHVFTRSGDYDVCVGEEMEQKTSAQIRSYIEAADMPYIIKGVLSVQDAKKAAELGAAGIVVSHHGGRMDFAIPPLMILPDIKKAVGDSLKIFVDCGVRSGMDAYKALALGADGVCVGNELLPKVKQGGCDAVAERIMEMTRELKGVMAFTGVKDTKSFDPTVLHRKGEAR